MNQLTNLTADQRDRYRARIAQHVLAGADIAEAVNQATTDAHTEALALGWNTQEADLMAATIRQVGVEWVSEMVSAVALARAGR